MDVDGTLVGSLAAILGPMMALALPFFHRRAIAAPWRIGQAHLAERNFVEAEAKFRETLELAERRFGRNDRRTALHLNALGLALLGQGKLDEAGASFDLALELSASSATLASERAAVLLGASAYATERGDDARGHDLLEKARVASARHAETRALVERTAAVRATSRGDTAAAADAYARIPSEYLAPFDVARLARIGVARLRAGDSQRAVTCLRCALDAAVREGPGDFAEAFLRGLLGEALARAGRRDEATRELEQAVVDYDAVAGERNPAVAPVLIELAELREHGRDLDGARRACVRVLALPGRPGDRTSPYRVTRSDDPLVRERERASAILARIGPVT